MAQALGTGSVEGIFEGCCNRLVAAGVPLSRGFLAFRTLHPLYAAMTVTWRLGKDVVVHKDRHGEISTRELWQSSPMRYMLQTRTPVLRHRLSPGEVRHSRPVGGTTGQLSPIPGDDVPRRINAVAADA